MVKASLLYLLGILKCLLSGHLLNMNFRYIYCICVCIYLYTQKLAYKINIYILHRYNNSNCTGSKNKKTLQLTTSLPPGVKWCYTLYDLLCPHVTDRSPSTVFDKQMWLNFAAIIIKRLLITAVGGHFENVI